jgi:hypothetical protein
MRRSLAAVEQYSQPLFVMDPIVARGFVDLGFDTKEKLIAWCADNALMTAREYWDNQWIQYLMRPRAWPASSRTPRVQGRTRRGDQDLRALGDQHRRRRRRDAGRWKMISGSLRATVSIDAWR